MSEAISSTRVGAGRLVGATPWRRLAVAAGALAIVAFFAVVLIWPLALVGARSIGAPAFHPYVEDVSDHLFRTVLFRTLLLAGAVTALCLAIAYPAAYGLLRLPGRARGFVIALILIPYLTSFIVRTYAWIGLLGVESPILKGLRELGAEQASLVGTFFGVVVALVSMLLPLMILPIFAAMMAIDRRELAAAASLGGTPAQAFARVFMPQTLTGAMAGCVLVFTASLGFFIVPALIGGGSQTTVAHLIYIQLTQLFEWETAASLAVLLFGAVVLIYAACGRVVPVERLLGLGSRRSGSATMKPRGRVSSLLERAGFELARRLPGQRRDLRLSYVALGLALFVLDAPLLIVAGISLQPQRLLALPSDGLSTRWYEEVLADSQWQNAAWLSLRLAIVAMLIALVVGYAAALRVHSSRRRLERVGIAALCLAPLAVPVMVLAIGVFGVYIELGWIGKFLAVAAAHAMLALPFVFVNVLNGLSSYDERFDQAASSLGARPWRVLARVRLPLLAPSIGAAAAFAFLVSFDELVLTLFLGGLDFQTLPLRMWAGANQDLSPELAVIGTLLIAVTLALWFAAIGRRGARVTARARTASEGP